jgi:transcriptional regulator with GAF, ATPase, and Fis domain
VTSLSQLRRRHIELFSLSIGLLSVAIVTTIVMAVDHGEWLLAASLGVLAVLFCGYIIDTEIKIHSLSKKLLDEELGYLEAQARESILNNKIKELSALRAALEALAMERRPDKALEAILNEACALCDATRGSIMLVDPVTERFITPVSRGLKPEHLAQVQPRGHSVAGQVVASGRPLLITGSIKVADFSHFIKKETIPNSSLCVPLRAKGAVMGVLNCSSDSRTFTEYDLQLMSLFAHYAELVLERALVTAPKHLEPHASPSA